MCAQMNPNINKMYSLSYLKKYDFDCIFFNLRPRYTVVLLPARPASQTHDSHKGHMILNHESPAGRIKNCGEKSAFSICNFRFEYFSTCTLCLE